MIPYSGKTLFIKHKQYRDICWIVKAQYSRTGYIKYKAEVWNLGYVASWPMGIKQYIDIKYEEMADWLFTTDTVKCLRNAKWEPLS